MKKISIAFLLLTLLLQFSQPLFAEDGDHGHHEHEGYYGGYFADADDIVHFEFILNQEGLLIVYLYDGEIKPLDTRDYPAKWALAPDNAYPLKGELKAAEHGQFYALQLPPHQSEIIHLQVEVEKEGEWIGLEYYLPVGLAEDHHDDDHDEKE